MSGKTDASHPAVTWLKGGVGCSLIHREACCITLPSGCQDQPVGNASDLQLQPVSWKVEADLCPLPSSLAAAPLHALLRESPGPLTQRKLGRQVCTFVSKIFCRLLRSFWKANLKCLLFTNPVLSTPLSTSVNGQKRSQLLVISQLSKNGDGTCRQFTIHPF